MENKFNIDEDLDQHKVGTETDVDNNLPLIDEEETIDTEAEVIQEPEEIAITVPAVPKIFKFGEREVNEKLIKDEISVIKKMTIKGIDDKEGYDKVKKKVTELRTTRTTLEKWRKATVKPLLAFTKDLKANTDKIGGLCEEGEKYGESLLAPIDAEKERIKKEKEELAKKMIQDRVKELNKYGAEFDGQAYTFPYDTNLHVSVFQTEHMDLAEFNELLEDVKKSWDVEQARLIKVENDRVAEENRQKELIASTNKLAEDLKNKRSLLRKKELRLSGFSENGGIYKLGREVVTESIISDMEDDKWDEMIASALLTGDDPEDEDNIVQIPRSHTYVSRPMPEVEPPADTVESGTPSVQGFEVEPEPEVDLLSQIDDADADAPHDEPIQAEARGLRVKIDFDDFNRFIDVEMSKQFIQRFFPVEYFADAHKGFIEAQLGKGATQIGEANLYYILIKKIEFVKEA